MNAMKEYLFLRRQFNDVPQIESNKINGFPYSVLSDHALSKCIDLTFDWYSGELPLCDLPR